MSKSVAPFSLKNLTENELIALNRSIVQEIKLRRELDALKSKSRFSIGMSVTFKDKLGRDIVGKVIKVCQKNVQVQVGGTKWTCSPQLVTPMKDVAPSKITA